MTIPQALPWLAAQMAAYAAPDAHDTARQTPSPAIPWVTLKAACTLDGKIAPPHRRDDPPSDPAPYWITGPQAREAGHVLRAMHHAILVGIGTVLADDPALTTRLPPTYPQLPTRQPPTRLPPTRLLTGQPPAEWHPEPRHPVRVVLDSRARIPLTARVLAPDGVRRVVICGSAARTQAVTDLQKTGVAVLQAPTPRPEPGWFLPRLAQMGIASVLVEGGAQVHGTFLGAQVHGTFLGAQMHGTSLGAQVHGTPRPLARALTLFMAPAIMGAGGLAWCGEWPAADGGITPGLSGWPRLSLYPPEVLGEDILLCGLFQA